ncbi:hypothetical protein [Candidatus Methylacidithermus pantelleriae]|uniref:Uncharacterized protein n=1 Tax=Candidatus Methylacidithermus pantelleriae TaxID=2744239 RepID=A0A8J2BQW8_9BACT|nr:hypothetical protein [Candidatus Methylacidithermus pantelleriae]CAF0700333.1 hypothetical protein MPNT_350015 [Candidatus Methylacidithermus pantelleriae]
MSLPIEIPSTTEYCIVEWELKEHARRFSQEWLNGLWGLYVMGRARFWVEADWSIFIIFLPKFPRHVHIAWIRGDWKKALEFVIGPLWRSGYQTFSYIRHGKFRMVENPEKWEAPVTRRSR